MTVLSNIITPTNVLTASSTATLTNKTINGSSNTITNVSLTTGVTGTLPVANGGTGVTTSTGSGSVVLSASPTLTGSIYANGSYRGNVTAVAALDIDCSAGNYFTKTINGASTFTFSNAPSGSYAFTLELTVTSGSATWPAAVAWPSGTAPTLSSSKTSLLMFVTDDSGTRWRGAALVDYTT